MADYDKPLSHLTEVEKTIDPVYPEPDDGPAVRLRAFEDNALGEDHSRHNDAPEKGIGSPFSRLSDAHKAHHAALVAVVEAEKEHQIASGAADVAHAKLEAAINRAAETEKEI